MIIIFEGPDGAGKTTLADAWSRRVTRRGQNVERVNHGPYLDATENQLYSTYMHDVGSKLPHGITLLVDRCWISEAVYGPVARGKDRIGKHTRQTLEHAARAAGAILIICLPPYEKCKEAYLARKELEYLSDETQLKAVYDGFAAMKSNAFPPLPTFWYDWTQEVHRGTFIETVETQTRKGGAA